MKTKEKQVCEEKHHLGRNDAIGFGEPTRPPPVPAVAPPGAAAMQSLNGDPFQSQLVVGEVADHGTRGRVRSPFLLDGLG